MRKRILISVSVIAVVAAIVIGGTYAFFSDTETSTGNVFTAGSIDLKVDHTLATYNGEPCVPDCQETGNNLILNGGFETPDIPAGTWAVYTNADVATTKWTIESGAGLEIQDHAAGNPYAGQQLGELDSNNSSAISQTLTTVAGGKYRLVFWYSPRPNRPAGDNTIDAVVKVVSNSTVLVDQEIGAAASGNSQTNWTKYYFDFVAQDTSTKVIFSDAGTNNSYGGYLDEISVRALNCGQYQNGGTCTLWGEKDLGFGDTFWTFSDVKPGDRGTNVISLHVDNNDAYVCLDVKDAVDNENSLVDPEKEANDAGPADMPNGELSKYLKLFVWADTDGDGVYAPAEETPLYEGALDEGAAKLALAGNTTKNLGMAWCMGDQTVDDTSGAIDCSGAGDQNDAQTDSLVASLVAFAEQQRNNSSSACNPATPPITQ